MREVARGTTAAEGLAHERRERRGAARTTAASAAVAAADAAERTLNVVDTCTRECLAIEVDLSLTGERVTLWS